MKIAPIAAELGRRGDEFEHVLVHTGQHYDREMSEIFLEELGVGDPDYSLGVGSGSHAQQTAAVMERLEPVLLEAEPDIVLVPGDVNSTLAASLTAAKLLVPIGHVEAGLRSLRPDDAGGDQPDRRRPALAAPLHPLARRRATTCWPRVARRRGSTTSATR